MESVEALRRAGHECVEFKPIHGGRILEVFAGLSSADGYKTLLSHIQDDPTVSTPLVVFSVHMLNARQS